MIPKDTIDKIFEAARIEEVVGDFVPLKKKGVNYLGNCPFHNEKTPSFTVSPTKGIYKCFGCGKGGNSVKFIMEIEHYTYPEALKVIAKKYQIEIIEKELTNEQQEKQSRKESLYIVSKFANDYFQKSLWETEEGKTIGLSYFQERGFKKEIGFLFSTYETTKAKGYSGDHFDIIVGLKTDGRLAGSVIVELHEPMICPTCVPQTLLEALHETFIGANVNRRVNLSSGTGGGRGYDGVTGATISATLTTNGIITAAKKE